MTQTCRRHPHQDHAGNTGIAREAAPTWCSTGRQTRAKLMHDHAIRQFAGFSIRMSPRLSVSPGLTVKSLRTCHPLLGLKSEIR